MPSNRVPPNYRAARSRSESILVTTEHDGQRSRRPDELIVEEPMTVQLDGVTVSTTMRTPGHDFELAVGFCHTEGLLVLLEGLLILLEVEVATLQIYAYECTCACVKKG